MKNVPTCTLSLFALLTLFVVTGPALACTHDGEPATSNPAQSDAPASQTSETVDPETFPEVVARVSATEITKTELIERAKAVRARLQIDGSTLDFYRQVLDELVGAELLYQAGTAKGYAPSEDEMNAHIDTIRSRFPSEEVFSQQLSSQGLTLAKLREMVAKDMSIDRFVTTEIAPRATVSEEEKKEFYAENDEAMTRPEQAKLSHILVKVEQDSPPEVREQARKKAGDLRQRLQAGEDFSKIARESSDDPASRSQGGDLSWVSRGQTVPAFEEAAFALKPHELSEVVETPFGYHIIKLVERRPVESLPYEEVEQRIGEFLSQQHLQEEVKAEVEALKAKSKVEIFI